MVSIATCIFLRVIKIDIKTKIYSIERNLITKLNISRIMKNRFKFYFNCLINVFCTIVYISLTLRYRYCFNHITIGLQFMYTVNILVHSGIAKKIT